MRAVLIVAILALVTYCRDPKPGESFDYTGFIAAGITTAICCLCLMIVFPLLVYQLIRQENEQNEEIEVEDIADVTTINNIDNVPQGLDIAIEEHDKKVTERTEIVSDNMSTEKSCDDGTIYSDQDKPGYDSLDAIDSLNDSNHVSDEFDNITIENDVKPHKRKRILRRNRKQIYYTLAQTVASVDSSDGSEHKEHSPRKKRPKIERKSRSV